MSAHSTGTPLPTEDIHTPAPHPARGIYGFALYIAAWFFLVFYLVWAFVPTPILTELGITYVPAKYWAIAAPLLIPIGATAFVVVIFCINVIRFRGYAVLDEVEEVENDFGERAGFQGLSADEARAELRRKCRNPSLFLFYGVNRSRKKIMLVRHCLPSMRFASRSATKKEFQKIGVSRGSQVTEIQKRLADFHRGALSADDGGKYKVDSLMSEKLIQNDGLYSTVLRRREEEVKAKNAISEKESSTSSTPFYPLSSQSVEVTEASSSYDTTDEGVGDRGFYVEAGQYVDEYVAGSTVSLPEDEMTAPSRIVFGSDDAVEHIDFQLPGQRTHEQEDSDGLHEGDSNIEWTEQFGSADPSRAASKHSCDGCGAKIHCKLNMNVCPVDYAAMMSHLKMKEEALILLVVDVTDLPGSIHKHLPNIIGTRKPMIVIGNKMDLLPPDAQCGYLKRFRNTVQAAIEEAGFTDKFNILHTALVSAKTGYGIEELITEIHLKWTNVKLGLRSDMYIVGCTNAGKSTLFNAFLGSDLCKVRAVDLVERATTSLWPGTTISLLKFPVMKPSPYRLEIRRRRLQKQRAWQQREMYARKLLLQDTGDSKYAVLTGTIQNTYKEEEENLQPLALKDVVGEEEAATRKKSWNADDPIFAKGTWCFDTPGTVCDHQIVSLFTLDELVKVLPRRLLIPRTALVPVGHSLLIGGVGRVDVLETVREHAVYLTAFVSDDLPLNIIKTDEVEAFFEKYLGKETLVVPSGGKRLEDWPGLAAEEFTVRGYKKRSEVATADVVLSSIGWVAVTTSDRKVKMNAWSVAGKGLATREPILPFCASLRGKRIPGTYFYKVKPMEFPVNQRRIAAQKNRYRR